MHRILNSKTHFISYFNLYFSFFYMHFICFFIYFSMLLHNAVYDSPPFQHGFLCQGEIGEFFCFLWMKNDGYDEWGVFLRNMFSQDVLMVSWRYFFSLLVYFYSCISLNFFFISWDLRSWKHNVKMWISEICLCNTVRILH